MGISRREFFRQLFSRKTLEHLNPLSTSQLDDILEVVQPSPTSPEEAGLGIATFKKRVAVVDTAVVRNSKNVHAKLSRGGCNAPNEQGKEGERSISSADMLSEPDVAMRSSPQADARESFHARSKPQEPAPVALPAGTKQEN